MNLFSGIEVITGRFHDGLGFCLVGSAVRSLTMLESKVQNIGERSERFPGRWSTPASRTESEKTGDWCKVKKK